MTEQDDELERLRASDRRLRAAIDAGGIGFWEHDAQTGASFANARCRELWGMSGDDVPAREAFVRAVHPDDRAVVERGLEGALRGVNGGAYELSCRTTSGGRLRWILARGLCTFDASGRPSRLHGTVIDVSDRERLREISLAQRRRAVGGGRLLERLVEATTPEESLRAVCEETAAALDVPFVSVRAIDERTRRTSSAYTVGAPARFVPQSEVPETRDAFLVTHGRIAQFLDIAWVPDFPSRERYVDVGVRTVAHAVMGFGPLPLGLLIVATFDQTRHFDDAEMVFLKSAADVATVALASARLAERYRQIVNTMTEGVVVGDAQQRILYVNPAFERLLGYPSSDVVGKPLDEFRFAEDLGERSDEDPPSRPRETQRFRSKSGRELWASVAVRSFGRVGAPPGYLAILTDVTEARSLDAKLQQAQKLESVGVLAGGIAHDFNNLLVGILGNAALARSEVGIATIASEALTDIQTAAMRASELTRQLLAYAGRGRFVISQTDVRKLVEEMGHLLGAVIPKSAVLRYDFARSLPSVDGDATQLRQVVMNLVTNAADALGGESGVITLSTRLVAASASDLAATYLDEALPGGDYVVIEVSDTGSGMSAETRARIFEPFFTTKFTGRGLGLAAVLGILRAHHGAIDVRSEPGKGTTIRVLLPAVRAATEALPPSIPAPEPAPAVVVLVVDDEEIVRRLIKRTLVRAGYRVLLAADGVEALEVWQTHGAEISLVVLDVMMPRMGGEETLARLRAISPDVRVLLASGFSETDAGERFDGKGVSGFLGKPFTPDVLLASVRELIAR